MTTADDKALERRARELARQGMNITSISQELGITWGQARGYTMSWLGAKVRITNRLDHLVSESDPAKRERLAAEAASYTDFLWDAAKQLRSQVDQARKALSR